MSQLRGLYRFVLPYWKRMLLSAAALVVWSLIGLALPWSMRFLVDSVFVSRDLSQLNLMAGGLLALFLLQAVIAYWQVLMLTFVAQRVISDLRLAIHRHMLDLPLRFFNERRTGEIVSRLTNDVTAVQNVLTEVPISLLRQVVTIVGGLALMLTMNWRLTLLVFALIPPLIAIGMFFGRRLEKLSTVVQDRLAEATAVLDEAISGIRVVKSFTQEDFERARFSSRIEDTFQTVMKRTRLRAIFIPLITLLGFSAVILLLWFGGQQVIAGELTPGELVAFLFYMVLVAGPMGEFAGLYSQLREANGAAKRVFEILESPPEPAGLPSVPARPELRGAVRFIDVAFGYDTSEPILEGINLAIQPDQVIALVGPSGVGKTTLVNLIPRFFDPTQGCIEIDGVDTRSMVLRELRANIGLVPQETFLFAASVRENIAYGRPGAAESEIEAAARAAYAHDFILGLADGYDSLVGERGIKLSAGQRQRVAIARALLKDPRILILDEATSALDSESEHWVQAALERLMEGRTTFVIAHRLSTIQRADRILVFQDGRIAEDGTHADLMARGGAYHHLWSLQFPEMLNG